MDSHDVTITITTGSINGRQGEEEIDTFAAQIIELVEEMLSHSRIEVDVNKHRRVVR